jgi:hypothetical protein
MIPTAKPRPRETAAFRACEGLIVAARLLARKPEDAAVGSALALGRLCRKMSPDRLEIVLGVVRRSYEAARA